ncbi:MULTISPECIES: endopeptidase La [unclassified Oceanispirochaeta]|uniref:endopeptidase La n=1 Tax=unclassified Oceanispirochaeta TaxID=2635722 RepID=UPI000E0909F6|nr:MULTISPECIES: endopeptidase La [unclassified Oceanispirochaeta]MBF9018707.1 endopeptidase La [Oceanispirochaeta sp. M2]NPD75145.1 endopeptidase La [Oceanispirochaeta sp. M1]RDG28998.1 endopeptidase La [Oceanispirochaeta sp. M1]
MNELTTIPEELPLVPMKGSILFPEGLSSVRISGLAEDEAYFGDNNPSSMAAAVSLKKNFNLAELEKDDFYTVGTLAFIQSAEHKNDELKISMRGVQRIKITHVEKRSKIHFAKIESLPDIDDMDQNGRMSMVESMKDLAREIAGFFEGTGDAVKQLESMNHPGPLMYNIIPYLNISRSDKQELLEISSLKVRGLKVIDAMISQKESLKLQAEIAGKMTEKASRSYRENVLREQLKVIQKELSESDTEEDEGFKAKIDKSSMPDEVRKVALKELQKLEEQPPNSPETRIIQNYLDLLVDLPWASGETSEIDLEKAKTILDSQHYGLEKVKKRIIQHLAVMKLKNEKKGSIILLVGPPGTGKTSLGKSIAEALDRKYVRASLGGMRDEAEIRGHRRTYVGALPGRIIQGMKKAGTRNPVFVLDEVDKLMQSYSGDPAAALLEVLDPEQNNSFSDHYLEVPYDLSEVFFVATANSLDSVPAPLLDRMEVITLSGYTNPEKFHIAENHLIPSVMEDHGLSSDQMLLENDALVEVIENYTREAGVRGLKKKIAQIARGVSEKVVSDNPELPIIVKKEEIEEYLDHQKVRHEQIGKLNPPGVVTGMAWTAMGGEILFVESTNMPGTGGLTITGQLGDVMKESAKISLSLIRSRLSMYTGHFAFKEQDIHIHVPSGAVPKDGPSAGVTLLTSLASLITGTPVNPELAMTGEVTLRGAVTPVGGVKEKVLAAHRAGVRRIILPADNEKDLRELPEYIRADLTVIPVETIQEVLKEALNIDVPDIPMPEAPSFNSSSSTNS